MPRKNAYAISLTATVQKRCLDLLEVINKSACEKHSGYNLWGALAGLKVILTNKKVHKNIK